ncbi:MAG TPA: hypothetical protein VKN18_07650 [Blastocatellia bacterium]|nr:hypothetical protein [Blastocatellia bacterium]
MTLLDQVKHIARVPSVNRWRYWWVSKEEIVLLKPATRNSKRFTLHRLNVTTGRQRAFDRFNLTADIPGVRWHLSTYGIPGYKVAYWTPRCTLSSDGEWFLWLRNKATWVAASLDGTTRREWEEEHSIPSDCCWLQDSERWVQLVTHYQRQRYTLVKAIVRSVVRQSRARTTVIKVPDGLLLGVTHHNSILLYNSDYAKPASKVMFREFSLSPKRPTRRYSIRLPESGTLSGAALSKAGDRLAWIMSVGDQTFPREYLFWVSDLDGKNIVELGRTSSITAGPLSRSTKQKGFYPGSVRWLPDGSEVSFVNDTHLYRVAIS